MFKTTVQIGKSLENYIAEKFKDLGYEKTRPSKGSGNRGELGDIAGQNLFIIECKKRNTKNITIKSDVWDKLKCEIPLHSLRMPLYVLENSKQTRLVVLEVDDFFKILDGYIQHEEEYGKT